MSQGSTCHQRLFSSFSRLFCHSSSSSLSLFQIRSRSDRHAWRNDPRRSATRTSRLHVHVHVGWRSGPNASIEYSESDHDGRRGDDARWNESRAKERRISTSVESNENSKDHASSSPSARPVDRRIDSTRRPEIPSFNRGIW